MSRLFGTDGVRGVANAELTPEFAFRLGRAAASALSSERGRPFVIGRDTRVSGTMLEAAIVAGLTSAGRDAVSLGIVPTPAVACVTRREGAAAGVVISASHNPIADNGIKFFGPDGFKLSDATEDRIEALLDRDDSARPTGIDVGVARVSQNLARHYYQELYEGAADLSGLHAIVDGAFGAAYAIAPYALRRLGATVTELHCESDGSRINVNCGATDLRSLQSAVRERAKGGERVVGVAFDGDADRALFVDETGAAVSGDHVMFALARARRQAGSLPGNAVVGTVMSNVGLEKALRDCAIALVRAPVGDRYVLEAMRSGGYGLGGEQSGHIIDLARNTTGDGPMTAVTLFGILCEQKTTLRELVAPVVESPQLLVNVATPNFETLNAPAVRDAIASAETALADSGRLLVRPSGTEPLIRVMAEGSDRSLVEQAVFSVTSAIEKEISAGP